MPGQRSPRSSRARGSRLPRLAGLGVVLLLAAGGAAAYLVTQHPAARPAPLPTRVVSSQTVGLVSQQAGSPGSQLAQLLSRDGDLQFSTLTPALAAAGTPQWTADLMAGSTYIFIYLPSGRCLSATGPGRRPELTLARCDLAAGQRWRRLTGAVLARGHDFDQYANVGDGRCLTEAGPVGGQQYAATLTGCSAAHSPSQLIAFWWGS